MNKTFGVIGVALAFYVTAKKVKKANLKAQLIPSTLTAVIAGITEPLEFTFIFAAPVLWLVYSILDGFFQMVTLHCGGPRLRHQRHPGLPGAEPPGRPGEDHVAHVHCHRPCGNPGHVRGI